MQFCVNGRTFEMVPRNALIHTWSKGKLVRRTVLESGPVCEEVEFFQQPAYVLSAHFRRPDNTINEYRIYKIKPQAQQWQQGYNMLIGCEALVLWMQAGCLQHALLTGDDYRKWMAGQVSAAGHRKAEEFQTGMAALGVALLTSTDALQQFTDEVLLAGVGAAV